MVALGYFWEEGIDAEHEEAEDWIPNSLSSVDNLVKEADKTHKVNNLSFQPENYPWPNFLIVEFLRVFRPPAPEEDPAKDTASHVKADWISF